MGIEEHKTRIAPFIYSGISLAIFLLIMMNSLLGVFFFVFTPLPLILLYLRHGVAAGRKGIIGVVLMAILVFTLLGVPNLLLLFLFYGIMALILGEAPFWRIRPDKALGLATIGSSLALLIMFGIAGMFSQANFSQHWEAIWMANLETMVELLKQHGYVELTTEQARAVIKASGEFILRISPTLLLVASFHPVMLNYLLAHTVNRRLSDVAQKGPGELSMWKSPERMVWPLIICGVLTAFGDGFLFWASLNCLIVMAIIYFMQGFAIMSYWLEKKGAPQLLRTVMYTSVYMTFLAGQVLALVVALVGLFDMWFDFRRLKVENEST
jgi:uncharacterized protein YybS (DUF2232 family)